MENTKFRYAIEGDEKLILYFIKELATYEKMADEVVANEKLLHEWIFDKKKAEVIFLLEDKKEIGFALFFHNFSTFLGRAGIYLEDLFVLPNIEKKVMEKQYLNSLQKLLLKETADVLNGGVLTGTSPA